MPEHNVPVLTRFGDTFDFSRYQPVPDDYWLGVADIKGSTRAVAEGKYKLVNTVGAAAIAAMINILGTEQASFIFGGDGASFLVPDDRIDAIRTAMMATAQWAEQNFNLHLRIALVPVRDIHAAGKSLLRADFAPSSHVRYSMFCGGGLDWADHAMKNGDFIVARDPDARPPNLEGLSCRWMPIENRHGCIFSVVIKPIQNPDSPQFGTFITELSGLLQRLTAEGHPIPAEGSRLNWPAEGLKIEQKIRTLPKWRINLEVGLSWLVIRNNMNIGHFSTRHYRETLSINSDFRKYGDGLYLTLDCSHEDAAAITACLANAARQNMIYYGTHMQSAALITCIVPRPGKDDHFHFIDGADGGYTRAATMLKEQIRRGQP